MAVLIEAMSVVIRRQSIDEKFVGGWRMFSEAVPNDSFCSDDELVRVGFMSPAEVEGYINFLESKGLEFVEQGQTVDIAVVDQLQGPTDRSEWLEFARVPLNESGDIVSACWLFEGTRDTAGLQVPPGGISLITPNGWSFAGSLSAQFRFIDKRDLTDRHELVRHESGNDVYLDHDSGDEVYVVSPEH